jgi:DNA invertase Pin-like site-specific DNA recombinase
MKDAIGYLRVSTREQGRSGLGLAAQRHDIEAFGTREGFRVKSWYQDIQTGAGADALYLRPGLAAALKQADSASCALVVSRLDRLSRNVHFISGLMEHRVHFVVAALGKDCDNFTLHIYASLAEQERKMISERCKAAAAILKRKGHKFGMAARSKAWQRRVSARGRAAWVTLVNERAEAYRPHIEWAFRQPDADGGPISYRAAADMLNERKVKSPMDRGWTGHQLKRTALRLGLDHPPGCVKNDVVRARVRAIWKQRPECTVEDVVASMGTEHPVGLVRTYMHLRDCRMAAAKRSSAQQRVGWRVDRFTATRIRIAELMKRRPGILGRQVVEKLGLEHSVRLKWVWRVMREYRLGAAKHWSKHPDKTRWPYRTYPNRRSQSDKRLTRRRARGC